MRWVRGVVCVLVGHFCGCYGGLVWVCAGVAGEREVAMEVGGGEEEERSE